MRISISNISQTRNADRIGRTQRSVTACRPSIEFKPLRLEDIAKVRKYMEFNQDRTCDYTIGGMFMWIDYFSYEYAIVNDTLFIKGVSENHPNMTAFSLPLGAMSLDESVQFVVDYCKTHELQAAFSAIPASKAKIIAEKCNGVIEKIDGWSDYLYNVKELASLSGKAFSKKRNHVNRFLSDNPNAKFEMLTIENIDEAKLFLTKIDTSAKSDAELASYELSQCREVLDNLDTYLFDGAILRKQDGEICALTLGEIVGDTLYIHVEKMDHEISGAGETINKLFAMEMSERHPEICYINREEDMNDVGLRFAKESYHPCALLDKCNVVSVS